jgi:Flp pilus assembly protein TadB
MIEAVPALIAVAILLLPVNAAKARLRSIRATSESRRSRTPRLSIVVATVSAVAALIGMAVFGIVAGTALGLAAAVAAQWWSSRTKRRREQPDPLALAAGWDLLAAGMRAGLADPVILRAVAEEFTGPAQRALREVADHLALGADAAAAWEPALRQPDTAELARAARRTARSGSGLADVAAETAAQVRASVAEQAEARAQRAAVWISAPLGVCFLPAFLCLGVLPVVAGMVQRLSVHL